MEVHFLQPNERVILQTSVRDYVRSMVNSEMFWQDLFRNVQIRNLIDQVNSRYFEAFDARGSERIASMESRGNSVMSDLRTQFSSNFTLRFTYIETLI